MKHSTLVKPSAKRMSITAGLSHVHGGSKLLITLCSQHCECVLKLAIAWEFLSACNTAVQQPSKTLEPSLIEKLIMTARFRDDSWVLVTLNSIVKRDGPRSTVDAECMFPLLV
jgi:hypothetical protein